MAGMAIWEGMGMGMGSLWLAGKGMGKGTGIGMGIEEKYARVYQPITLLSPPPPHKQYKPLTAAGTTAATPTPCRALNTINTLALFVNPHPIEKIVVISRPRRKVRRRPWMSARRPKRIRRQPCDGWCE